MDLELKLLDHIKLTSHLSKNFACGYSEDDRVFIINDSGIYILSLNGSVTFEFPSLALKKSFFCVSNYSPCSNINLDIKSFHNSLPKKYLCDIFMNTDYSATLKQANPLEATPLCAKWSPQGIAAGTDCVLAVLTKLNSLEIYRKFLDGNETPQYRMVLNITQEMIDMEKNNWVDAVRFPIQAKMEEFKKRVDSVSPRSFTWSHLFEIEGKNASVLFVGLSNGDINAWAILEMNADPNVTSKPIFLGKYHTHLIEIETMYWHYTNDYEGALFFANMEGRINFVHVSKLNEDKVEFTQEQLLHTVPDNALVSKITVMVHENKTFIIAAKKDILIVWGVNDRGKFFHCEQLSIEHVFVTGIHHTNKIFVLSSAGTLTQLTLILQNDTISFEKKVIPLKYDTVKYRTHGFFFSKNMAICGVLTYPSELRDFGKARDYVNVFVYHNTLMNPLELLWNNESGSLRHYWDCFEILRLTCLKEKQFPWLGLPTELNYDTLPLPKLKTLRWIAKLSEMVFRRVPVVKSYDIKPYILLHYLVEIRHALNRMRRLLALRSFGKELSQFQMRSLFVQNMFLKEMVVKDILAKANAGNTLIEDIMNVMGAADELVYPMPVDCVWCGQTQIIGPSCLPPHVDSRCSISMMPIGIVPTYKCPNCKALAHREIGKEQHRIFCGYCDVPLEMIVRKEDDEELKDAVSDCHKDCLKENIDFDDIEENSTEYVIFTDSEDDDKEQRLGEAYEKYSGWSLEEIVKDEVL